MLRFSADTLAVAAARPRAMTKLNSARVKKLKWLKKLQCLDVMTLSGFNFAFVTLLTSLIRHSDFVISLTYERSHMSDDIVTELRTLDLRRSLHQPCEIVSNAFARNRAL